MVKDLVVQEARLKHDLELGAVFAMSGNFSDVQNKAQAVIKIMAGRELGLQPITSMSQVFVVHNKVGIPGELMADLIKRSDKYDYRIKTSTAKACEIIFYEYVKDKKEEIGVSTFTIEEAGKILTTIKGVQKPLTSKDNWKNYPKDMLLWYTLKHGARIYCPDCIHGACLKDELPYVDTTVKPGIADKIDAAKKNAGSGAETAINGDIVEESEKPTGQPEKPTGQQEAGGSELPDGKEEPKAASLDKLKELVALRDKLPGIKEDKEQIYQIFKRQLKIETPDEEMTTAQVNTLIGIIRNNIPKGEAAAPEVPDDAVITPEPPASECPAGHCEACFAKGKKKKITAGALKLSKKMGKEELCFKCLQAANK